MFARLAVVSREYLQEDAQTPHTCGGSPRGDATGVRWQEIHPLPTGG